jgi:hypothetical protein
MTPVKQKTFKVLQWLVPAFLGIAVLIIGGTAVYFSMQRIPTATELLPADATVSYWHITNDKTITQLPPEYQITQDSAPVKEPFDLAFVQLEKGRAWILFPGAPDDPVLNEAKK